VDDGSADKIDHVLRGWRGGITVEFEDGSIYELDAYSPTRLSQDIDDELSDGRLALVFPNTIVVKEVSEERIISAINKLAETGWFFRQINPSRIR
jgi:hypothetical protein